MLKFILNINKVPLIISFIKSYLLSDKNGGLSAHNSYMIHPRDHMSVFSS